MYFEFLSLSEYWQFVYPAFFFTFFISFILYSKTLKKMKKYEAKYINQFGPIEVVRIKRLKTSVFSSSSVQ